MLPARTTRTLTATALLALSAGAPAFAQQATTADIDRIMAVDRGAAGQIDAMRAEIDAMKAEAHRRRQPGARSGAVAAAPVAVAALPAAAPATRTTAPRRRWWRRASPGGTRAAVR